MRARAIDAGLLLVLAACSGGVGSSIADPEPGETVLLVTIEGIARDRLAIYGAPNMPMVVLSELAAEGRVYEGLVPAAVGANASLASLFTGLAPEVHGVGRMRTLGGSRLADDYETVAEVFQREGWRTVAAVSQARLSAEVSGLEQGFDAYDAPPISSGTRPRRSGDTADALLKLVHEAVSGKEPLFAWLHLADLDEDRPAEAKWCEPWLQRHFRALAGADEHVAEALAGAPGEVFEALRKISVRRRGREVFLAWHAALHDAALERQDYALGRVLNALVASGRGDDLRVIVCGVEAGDGEASASARPGPGSFAPLVVWNRGESVAERVLGIVRGADVRCLLLAEELPISEEAWIVDADLLDAVRVGSSGVGAAGEFRAASAILSVSHPAEREGALVVRFASWSCMLRGEGDRRGERLRFVVDPGETVSIVTEERYPQLSLRLEGKGVDERAVRWGAAPLEELDVGVLGVGTAALWPAEEEGWVIDLARDVQDPSHLLLRVAKGGGAMRLVLEDAEDLEFSLEVRQGEVAIRDHALLFGARVVVGAAPFALEVRGVRPAELSVAAFADGVRVPVGRMRHMGRRWGGGGKVEWLISGPAWTALVRPGIVDGAEADLGRVGIGFGYRVPDERAVSWPGREARAFARRLGRTE